MEYSRIDLSTYIVTSIWFGCNNDCTLCMLSDMKGGLAPIGFERFKEALARVVKKDAFENLILSGAEVTTFPDLETYVRFAASLDHFNRIQIQTNGRRLASASYLKRLVDWGVDEFFVSIHGPEEIHDAIARRPGAFAETMAGFANLSAQSVNVISNSVLTAENLEHLPRLFSMLVNERISEIHLWNCFPMQPDDAGNRLVPLQDLIRMLPRLARILAPAAIPLVLKSFPECLPVQAPVVIDSRYPVTLLPDRFWQKFEENRFGQCFHRQSRRCRADGCWGLSEAYIRKFGDERRLLTPIAGSGPSSTGKGGGP